MSDIEEEKKQDASNNQEAAQSAGASEQEKPQRSLMERYQTVQKARDSRDEFLEKNQSPVDERGRNEWQEQVNDYNKQVDLSTERFHKAVEKASPEERQALSAEAQKEREERSAQAGQKPKEAESLSEQIQAQHSEFKQYEEQEIAQGQKPPHLSADVLKQRLSQDEQQDQQGSGRRFRADVETMEELNESRQLDQDQRDLQRDLGRWPRHEEVVQHQSNRQKEEENQQGQSR